MKRYLLLPLLAAQGWAYTSLAVSPGVSARLKIPATAPFQSLGDYRVEFRIHDWNVAEKAYTAYISWGSVYGGARYLEIDIRPPGEICAFNWVDKGLTRGSDSCASLAGHTDVIVRVQRFGNSYPSDAGASGSFLLEARDADGTPITSFCHSAGSNYACPIQTPAVVDWSGTVGYVGNPSRSTSFSLAWLKWFSTTVPPGSPFSEESTPADLADWRFNNDLKNEGTGGHKVAIESFTGALAYAATPTHVPACDAGAQQVFRAGYPAQLDGTGSYPLNGTSALTYSWQQLSGPTRVLWEGRDTVKPTIQRTSFGSYVFRLTVTDSGGAASSCQVKHGVVATDDKNVVITGRQAVNTLLGPLIRYGTNPWPWFDDRHKAGAALIMRSFNEYYAPLWEQTRGPGTISVGANSAVVTGQGTSFTTTFCQGPAQPTVPKVISSSNARLLVWYPNSSVEGYGLRRMVVSSCQSDTQLTLSSAWQASAPLCGAGGCRYSLDEYSGRWTYPAGEGANYYDVVAGLYALYYRTGIDDYRNSARQFADRFWKYRLDSGLLCNYGCGGSDAPRTKSLLGMFLRALDGRPDMWSGLETMVGYHQRLLVGPGWNYVANPLEIDIREAAYSMLATSYCGLFHPTVSTRQGCKTTLSAMMNQYWNNTRTADGNWHQLYSSANSWSGSGSSVSLTNGSAYVTGNGTSWTSSQFGDKTHIVFLPTAAAPANIRGQEQTYYTAAFIDSKHLRLDRPYEGTTGVHGWMLGYSATAAVGWGTQPFIQGILGLAFEFTSLALADSDAVNSARAGEHNASIANWQRNAGYRVEKKGMQYFAGTVDCRPPIPETSTWCTQSYTATQARTLNAEALRSVAMAYSRTRDYSLRVFADALYNAMYAKPQTCPAESTACSPDGEYISDLNDGLGWYMRGTPNNNLWHKYFGMLFGIGAGSNWPAYRVQGLQAARKRTVRLGFDLGSIPGAASARVTTLAPDGEESQTPCASSPCAVTIDEGLGDHIFNLEYLSTGGKVLASTALPLTAGR